MTLEIRPPGPGDAEWCAGAMAQSEPWMTLGRSRDDCLARCTHPQYTLLLASIGTERCGCLLLHPRGVAGSPYIAALVVAPEWRSQKVGAALLNHAEEISQGARFVFLCVSEFNTRARAFYERHGYRCVGELPDYVIDGASELLMQKRLVSA